ncbi:MAG: sulfatase/phosphatase domain-containing protein, partial [Pirellula sp.]
MSYGAFSAIDLLQATDDLAGIAIPQNMQGKSWRNLWSSPDKKLPWREDFFYSYFREGRFATPTVTALRTDSMKL